MCVCVCVCVTSHRHVSLCVDAFQAEAELAAAARRTDESATASEAAHAQGMYGTPLPLFSIAAVLCCGDGCARVCVCVELAAVRTTLITEHQAALMALQEQMTQRLQAADAAVRKHCRLP